LNVTVARRPRFSYRIFLNPNASAGRLSQTGIVHLQREKETSGEDPSLAYPAIIAFSRQNKKANHRSIDRIAVALRAGHWRV